MSKEKKYDVIVVGAGPGGSSTSFILARNGVHVLLIDKHSFPRDKSCGDGLTRTSTRAIHKLGYLEKFQKHLKIRGVKIKVKDEGEKIFPYPMKLANPNYGLTVPREILDHYMLEEAIKAGTEFRGKTAFSELIIRDSKICGIILASGEEIYADVVIGADGAASKIAYQANLASTPKSKLGFGIRAYCNNISGLLNQLEIYLPIMDGVNRNVLPSYGWVFPMGDGVANIGVGLFEKRGDDNIKDIMNRFIDRLKQTDRRFSEMSLQGKYFGAPMRFDFDPNKSYRSGLLLVGDAAGMISPFTGEGIGTAIDSGVEAANLILKRIKDSKPDFNNLEEYGNILKNKYQGYFEIGMESVRRYHLTWNVLKNTFNNNKPLFKILRTASVFPEGLGESFFESCFSNVESFVGSYYGELKTDLISVSSSIIEITRPHWPFISKLFDASDLTPGIPFRPSLFLLLAGYCKDLKNRGILTDMACAFELGLLANMCHDSVEEQEPSSNSKNWGNIMAVLTGDYLLAEAFSLMTAHNSRFIQIFSETIEASNSGQLLLDYLPIDNKIVADETTMKYLYQKNSASFELCFLMGSHIGKRSNSDIKTLQDFGKHFGAVFTIEETLLKLNSTTVENIIEDEVTIDFTNTNLFSSNQKRSFNNELLKEISKNYRSRSRLEFKKAYDCLACLSDFELREVLINFCEYLNITYDIKQSKILHNPI